MTHRTIPLPQDSTLAEMSDVQIRAIVGELIKANWDLKELNSSCLMHRASSSSRKSWPPSGSWQQVWRMRSTTLSVCIFSNFGTLEQYLEDLFQMLDAYEQAEAA